MKMNRKFCVIFFAFFTARTFAATTFAEKGDNIDRQVLELLDPLAALSVVAMGTLVGGAAAVADAANGRQRLAEQVVTISNESKRQRDAVDATCRALNRMGDSTIIPRDLTSAGANGGSAPTTGAPYRYVIALKNLATDFVAWFDSAGRECNVL